MTEMIRDKIKTAVETWAKEYYKTTDVISYVFADEDEPDRYIVVLAVRGLDDWQAAEAWVEEESLCDIMRKFFLKTPLLTRVHSQQKIYSAQLHQI